MLRPDELERLSRSLAGDLSPEEAQALEREMQARPELREGLKQLETLDREAAELSRATLDQETADRLVRGALGGAGGHGGRAWRWIGAAALAVSLALTSVVMLKVPAAPDAAEAIAISGSVWIDGDEMRLPARTVQPPELVETGVDGAAVIALPRGTLRLPPRSRLRLDALDAVQVERGTVLASADGVRVSGVAVHGDAVISVEPPPALDRVTEAIREAGGDMTRFQWTKLLPPAVAAVAVSGVAVFVLAGRAELAAPGGTPPVAVVVRSGEQWRAGAAAPAPLELAARSSSPPAGTAQPSMEAELARVRAERDALLKQRDELLASAKTAAATAAPAPTAAAAAPGSRDPEHDEVTEVNNPYRTSAATLRKRAERGEFVFHGPFSTTRKTPIPEAAARELGLSAEEQRQVLEAARAFEKRVHDRIVDIYVAEGGDRRTAEPMAAFEVLDLLKKLPGGDAQVDPVKQIAWELGGMAPALANPPALLRAFRALVEEENAYLDALDRILGPARAEALLNAGGLGRSTASYTSR